MAGNISEEVTLQYKYLTSMFSKVFGSENSHQLASHALAAENEDKFDDFMLHILDISRPDHQELYKNSKSVRFGRRLEQFTEEEKQLIRQTIEDKEREIHFRFGGWADESAAATADIEEKRKKTKKATKIHLSELHQGYLKQGRVPCECQAIEHKLINNCIECGRIVCEQEGSGPCLFCDAMVVTPEEQEILNSNTKQANQLYNALKERKKSDDWKKLIERRDKLISFDEQFSVRTKIIDEDEDYFDVNNKWLSEKQRKKLKDHTDKEKDRQEQMNTRLNKSVKYTFDIEKRKAIEEREEKFVFKPLTEEDLEDSEEEYDDHGDKRPKMPDVSALIEAMKLKCEAPQQKGVLSTKKVVPKPKIRRSKNDDCIIETKNVDPASLDPTNPDDWLVMNRLEKLKSTDLSDDETEDECNASLNISDDEYGPDEMPTILDPIYTAGLDFGFCLSMHQPWASLLVYGIKKHEGRGWPTDHRGRLWIASTAKPAEKEDVENYERFYRKYYEDTTVVFPKVYPTSVLLGSIFIQDCVDQEDYEKYYQQRELEGSPYVFICEAPETLPFPLPIKGKPKIYTLPLELHKTARKALGLKKNDVKW